MINTKALFIGNTKLFIFWLSHLYKLLKGLPLELTNSNLLAKRMAKQESFVIKVSKSLITQYNNDINTLSNEIASLHSNRGLSFNKRQIGFWMIRLLVIIAAFYNNKLLCFLLSLLQFILLPYSLFVAVGYGIETSLVLFAGHVLVFPVIKYSVDLLLPDYLNIKIPFSPLFIVVFLLADQMICVACLYETPKGKTLKKSMSRVLESIWYGFLNCKTYYLILIPLLFNTNFPLTVWVIDYILGVSTMVSKYINGHWEFMFYHVHRISHINYVYPDAHKFHHYLKDTTAFDAHIFGSGAPEEWLLLINEYLIASFLCGIPPCLSYYVLSVSWYNKWGFHSRNIKPKYASDNFHADHHLVHNKNFGFEYPLEMVMNTTFNRNHFYNGYKLKRIELNDFVVLEFTLQKQKN